MSQTQLAHLACIMDGNRRYARQQSLPQIAGHKLGLETVGRVIDFCCKEHIQYLSLYAFSLENFKRSPTELSYLFDLIIDGIRQHHPDLVKAGIRVTFVGDRACFPSHVLPAIDEIERATQDAKTLFLQVLFCYGGQQEIVHAIQNIVTHVQKGVINYNEISTDLFKKYLWLGSIPEPDLVIRTGGVKRLSNFLLYQTAYSELYFTDTYWPALQQEELYQAMRSYYATKRNFGV